MNIHVLKAVPPYYREVESGRKPFELRKNDRNFHVEDLVFLCEYLREGQEYTGHILEARVTYIFEHDQTIRGLMPGYVILGISVIGSGYVGELDGAKGIDLNAIRNSRGFSGIILG